MGLPTPNTSHLLQPEFRNVYEPAEDTFLLLDALEAECQKFGYVRPTICLEVGSGSGCVSAFLARLLDNKGLFLTTDINAIAARATQITATRNNVSLDVVRTKFTDSLTARLSGQVDILIFNPPYVVTPREEVGSTGIEAAWAGGIDGREVTDKFLPYVPLLLSPNGRFYLVLIRENKPTEITQILASQYNLKSEIILSRKAGSEGLCILKVTK